MGRDPAPLHLNGPQEPGRRRRSALITLAGVCIALVATGLFAMWRTTDANAPEKVEPSSKSLAASTNVAPTTQVATTAQLAVVVANASGSAGLAATKVEELKAAGYASATYTSAIEATLLSKVFFVTGSERDANAVAGTLGLPRGRVAPIPDPPPVANLTNTRVVVLIGQDRGLAAPQVSQPAQTAPPVTSSRKYDIGAIFSAQCVIAWPTAPVRSARGIEMTTTCADVSGQFQFVDVFYRDPNLPVTPSRSTMQVHGRVSDVAQSEYGFKVLVIEADSVTLR